MKFSLSLLAIGASMIHNVLAMDVFSITDALVKRQGGAFIPPSSSTTCSAENKCGTRWCLRPGRGDLCCSEGYACPSTSYCLTKGYCCPIGLDLAACALANKVTLPANFNTQTIAAGAPTAGAASSLFGSLSLSVPSIAKSSAVSNRTTTTASFNGGVVGRPSATTTASQFTGAAAAVVKQAAGGLAAAAAVVGYFI